MLVGRAFTDWLESKLADNGIAKIVPEHETVERAYARAWRLARTNEAIADASDEIA